MIRLYPTKADFPRQNLLKPPIYKFRPGGYHKSRKLSNIPPAWAALSLMERLLFFLPFCRGIAILGVPSVDKGRYGFDGQKCAHTASRPLEIRQVFPAGLSLSGRISARQNCLAPASDGFSSDFWLLSRRWAGAHQGEKDKKRRKGALAGVFALVNRW